jgi:hypothetical protein
MAMYYIGRGTRHQQVKAGEPSSGSRGVARNELNFTVQIQVVATLWAK